MENIAPRTWTDGSYNCLVFIDHHPPNFLCAASDFSLQIYQNERRNPHDQLSLLKCHLQLYVYVLSLTSIYIRPQEGGVPCIRSHHNNPAGHVDSALIRASEAGEGGQLLQEESRVCQQSLHFTDGP